MAIDEVEVYFTPNGLGRAAIVRRKDGLFCIYVHLKLPLDYLPEHFTPSTSGSWINDTTPHSELYRDKEPRSGLFGTVDDARREVRSLTGFSDAVLKT
jgi:hypothetical protein